MTRPTLETIVEVVAKAADREGFTPHGLRDYLLDLDKHPEVYADCKDAIEARIFAGSGVEPEDVTDRVCRLAANWHRESLRNMVRRWQKEADEAKVPITYVMEGDSEVGWDSVMNRTRMEAVDVSTPTKPKPGKPPAERELLGHPLTTLVRWMGFKGYDPIDAIEVVKFYGGEAGDGDIMLWIAEGKKQPGLVLDDEVEERIEEALG